MSRGVVVDHKETGIRYAVSTHNFNEKIHDKVRDLKPGESVIGYRPKPKGSREEQGSPAPTLFGENELVETPETPAEAPAPAPTPGKHK